MDSVDTSKGFLETELAVKHVARNDNGVLTIREEQQLLYGNSVTCPTPQSSPSASATNRGSFDMMRTCFSPVVQSHIDAPREPIGDMLPSLKLPLGPVIPASMSQCKSSKDSLEADLFYFI
ncbi:hypothetical protein PRUPE_3G291400 [Prunus persica]|uniref:Uncharacterized protein n=1 Tax=Prunus persica TaxID=3760 RepID=A0A251Q777_PRUPE|nr:hypothetical protein PRUPE_3G291400 [Prunus persica]